MKGMTKEKERRGFGGFIELMVRTSGVSWAMGKALWAVSYGCAVDSVSSQEFFRTRESP